LNAEQLSSRDEVLMVNRNSYAHWWEGVGSNTRAGARLYCFPNAGGGASLYRSWLASAASLEICPLVLPGRERRLMEQPHRRLGPLVQTLIEILPQDKPFAFFGHSMGAVVGFEVARQLRRQNLQQPTHLFVSAHAPPELLRPRTPPRHLLSDCALTEELRSMKGTDERIFSDVSFMEVILPAVRADFELIETYAYQSEEPLDIPVTAMGGDHDEEVTRDELGAWRAHTRSTFTLRMYSGGHFYLRDFSHLQVRDLFSMLTR
jgi:medium-chain acyl-[acyl-carrier-protein] hydrolase